MNLKVNQFEIISVAVPVIFSFLYHPFMRSAPRNHLSAPIVCKTKAPPPSFPHWRMMGECIKKIIYVGSYAQWLKL